MTAVPIPKCVEILEDDSSCLFPVKDIRKNLAKDFATPLVRQRLSRMSSQAYIATSDFMKVYLRLRPFSDQETAASEDQKCMEVSEDGHVLTLHAPKDSNKFKTSAHGVGDKIQSFSFTKIFRPDTSQKQFFDLTALKIVQDFIGGQNSLIFTYGVTNSGKTYTIQGSPGNEGIMPRAVDVVFNSIGDQLIEDSNMQLQMANSVVVVSDEEKVELLQQKKEMLALADETQDSDSYRVKDSLEPSINSSQSSEATTCPSANSTVAGDSSLSSDISQNKKRLSFMEFAQNVADDSFVDISAKGPVRYVIFVSFVEIYNEYIYDLLEPLPKGKSKKRTILRLAEDKKLPFVKGLREIQVSSREEVFKLLTIGRNHLHIAETKLNHNSSRSHCIFSIKTVCTKETDNPQRARVTQMSFCDLAGSERWGKTNCYGERLKEAGKINTSLLTLGKCIETLRHNQQHRNNVRVVPYRDSRLTRLFQSFLMGYGKACMIVNVNQCSSMFDETMHALKFSSIAFEVRVPKRRTLRMSFRKSQKLQDASMAKNSRKTRTTIGWEPVATPIQEESDEESDSSDDSDQEEDTSDEEHDDAYWKARENKLVGVINLLQNALKEEKKKVYITERNVREEMLEEMDQQVVDIENKWVARLERREDLDEKKLCQTVELANAKLQNLNSIKISLEKENKELDQECNELDEKLETAVKEHAENVENLNKIIANVESKLQEAQKLVKQKDAEIKDLKKSKADSLLNEKHEDEIETLHKENEDGREIIKEQLQQLDAMKQAVERNEAEMEKLMNGMKETQSMNEMQMKDIEKLEAENVQLSEKTKDLEGQNEKLDDEMRKVKQNCLKESIQSGKEMENMKEELTQANLKNNELTVALEETLSCAEKKNLESHQLNQSILILENTVQEKNKQLEKTEKERDGTLEKLDKMSGDARDKDLKHGKEIQMMQNDFNTKIQEIQQSHEKEIKDVKKAHKKEILSLETKVRSACDEAEDARKELAVSSKLESQLMTEIKRLEEQTKKLECEKTLQAEQQQKRTSQASELAQDVNIFMKERDDLLKTIEQLKQDLSNVSKEKTALENNQETVTVAEATELERLKSVLKDMDEAQIKQQDMLNHLEAEKAKSENQCDLQEEKLRISEKEKGKLAEKLEEMKESRDSAENLRSQIAEALRERDSELKDMEDKVGEEMQKSTDLCHKIKNKDREIQKLRQEVDDAIDSKHKDLAKFREGRDRIASALEDQINAQKSCNRALKDKLDTQIAENVQYRSENSRLLAELAATKLHRPELKKSVSASVALRRIKQEYQPHQESEASKHDEDADQLQSPALTIATVEETPVHKRMEEVVTMLDMSTGTSPLALTSSASKDAVKEEEKESDTEAEPMTKTRALRSGRKTRSRSSTIHQPSVKRTSTRRKRKTANRPATPLPSDIIEDKELNEAPIMKATRRKTKRTISSTSVASAKDVETKDKPRDSLREAKDQTLANEVLDDSALMRATGNSQRFPKSEMEIDVTPQLKKTRGRKRTNKQKEEVKNATLKGSPRELTSRLAKRLKVIDKLFDLVSNEHSDDSDEPALSRTKSKRRGKAAQENADVEENVPRVRNVAKMGDILRNSPVGQAFKKIEAAISPSRAPATVSTPHRTALTHINDQLRQSTRRLRKLHADDISLPLETTPNEQDTIGAVGRGVGVLSQTQNMGAATRSRGLRHRK
ncbi:uncharacterized protein LOC143462694 isoform X3 [Clavelina lepadiformis]|uniref:uncharacterized protein LOC143462694 isoform X3 n=1 Tax=Clavelina lepadiformis TaxID=159417 RepID=UPI004041DFBE